MNQPPDNRLLTGFAPFPLFELSPARTALIVVGMQYVDAHPDSGIGRAARVRDASFCNVRSTQDIVAELSQRERMA